MPVVYMPGQYPADDNGTEPPDNGDMEARITRLENIAEKTAEQLHAVDVRLAKIETRLETFATTFATKADVSDAKNSIIMWVVSAILLAQLLPALLKKFGL